MVDKIDLEKSFSEIEHIINLDNNKIDVLAFNRAKKLDLARKNLIKNAVEIRKMQKLTQADVARLTSIGGSTALTQQMVSRIEKLNYMPTFENLMNYIDAIGYELALVKKQ